MVETTKIYLGRKKNDFQEKKADFLTIFKSSREIFFLSILLISEYKLIIIKTLISRDYNIKDKFVNNVMKNKESTFHKKLTAYQF